MQSAIVAPAPARSGPPRPQRQVAGSRAARCNRAGARDRRRLRDRPRRRRCVAWRARRDRPARSIPAIPGRRRAGISCKRETRPPGQPRRSGGTARWIASASSPGNLAGSRCRWSERLRRTTRRTARRDSTVPGSRRRPSSCVRACTLGTAICWRISDAATDVRFPLVRRCWARPGRRGPPGSVVRQSRRVRQRWSAG